MHHSNNSSGDGEHGGSPRLLERACDSALFGDALTADEMLEARAMGLDLGAELEQFELTIAQLEAERFKANPSAASAVPPALRDRLGRLANNVGRPSRDAGDAPASIPIANAVRATQGRRTRARDWVAAAACIAFGAVSTFLIVRAGSAPGQELPTDPARFVSLYPTAVRVPWQGTKDSHVVGKVKGEAIFDPRTSKGLLVIEGLAPNDPSVEQYQLWIFDATRDERYPVDGGVFDMPACGQAAVSIEAKLRVDQPVLFAVTVEKPGGVVVSDRRIALVAKP
jgi:hypothetical protein